MGKLMGGKVDIKKEEKEKKARRMTRKVTRTAVSCRCPRVHPNHGGRAWNRSKAGRRREGEEEEVGREEEEEEEEGCNGGWGEGLVCLRSIQGVGRRLSQGKCPK